jgi:hypothetical protein
MIRCVCLREWDFFNENQKDRMIRRGAFGDPPLSSEERLYAGQIVGVDGTEKWAEVR